ncbi:MAG: hypothetical protein Q4A00_03995 [Flavobacteriaceae bacterium]|nr:hypothetical protein [Flavobacteriaceae bacterium]
MEDYKQVIKELITQYFSPSPTGGEEIYKGTFEILVMCKGVIPTQPISEHDVFEVMKELGFSIELQPVEDEETGQENDMFLWKLYENK